MKRHGRKKSGQGTLAIVLIVVVILVIAYLFVPAFQAWVNGLLNQVTGGDFTGFGMTIYYTDGTSKHVDPSPVTITSMSVQYGGKSVSKIVFELWLKVSYTGEVSSNTVSGTMSLTSADDIAIKSSPLSYSTVLQNAVSTKIATIEITAAEIQSINPIGIFGINAQAPITVQMNFNDGTSDSESATANGSITVYVQPDGSITGMTVSFTPSPIYV